MNKIALILGLSLSLSAHAYEPYKQTDILVMAGTDGSTLYVTFDELEAKIEDENPIQFEWCHQKANLARSVLDDRDRLTRDEIMDELLPIKPKMRHFMWLEVERIVSEVHRYDSKGNFEMEQTPDVGNDLYAEEYQKCITRGF